MWLLRVSWLALALSAPCSSARVALKGRLAADIIRGPANFFYITLTNASEVVVTGVNVVAVDGSGKHQASQSVTLAPGQQELMTVSMSESKATDSVVLVRYTVDGQTNSLALAQPLAPQQAEGQAVKILALLLPTALGSALTLFGVWLTSLFNLKKETITARLKWKQFLFEHYDANYRAFLSACSGALDPNVIQQCFVRLDSEAIVPSDVRALITEAIAAMRSTPAETRRVRDELLNQVRQQLTNPL